MTIITNTQAPAIIEDIVRAHHLPGRFRADTANNSLSTILCTIDEVDAEARKVLFTVRKRGLRTLTRQRSIRTGKGRRILHLRRTHVPRMAVPDMGGTRRHHGRFLHPLPHP